MSVILLIVLFVLAWVVLILPKQRELKRHNALVASLEVGDEVMSGSGLYGTIARIEGDIVYLEVAPGLELKLARRAVAARVTEPAEPEELLEGDEANEGWPSTVDADGEPVDDIDREDDESSLDEPDSEPDTADADADADDAGGRRGLD